MSKMTRIHAQEIATRLGTLRGIVHSPECQSKGAAVICHGFFSSTKVGPARLYVQLERLLAEMGYTAWRFDCYGVGDSDGEFIEASYESELDDCITVAKYAASEELHGQVVFVGHSMGTTLATMAAAALCGNASRLLLLSPSFGRIPLLSALFNATQLSELNDKGITVRKGIEIKQSFIEGLESPNTLKCAESVSIPATVVYGTSDEFYTEESIMDAARALRAKVIAIPGGDHNFLNLDSRRVLLAKVRQEIREWDEKSAAQQPLSRD